MVFLGQNVLTSNFDDQLTQAFDSCSVLYDLVFYIADGSEKGKFKHKPPQLPGPKPKIHLIETEEYDEFKIGENPIILQLYGRWDKTLTHEPIDVFKNNFFVIDQIQFNGLLNNLKNLPNAIRGLMQDNNILFVGYHSNDYELQMIMEQLHIIKPSSHDPMNHRSLKLGNSWLIVTHKQQGNNRKLAESIWRNFNTEIKPISQTIEQFAETLIKEMIPH